MPSATNITLATGHTFVPQTVDRQSAVLVKTTEPVIALQPSLILSFAPATSARKTDRIEARLNIPLIKIDTAGNRTSNGVARFIGTVIVPDTATEADRTLMEDHLAALMITTEWKNYMKRLPMY